MGAMAPIGRIGEPDEIAESAVWLCSDAARFVTGHALAVDRGSARHVSEADTGADERDAATAMTPSPAATCSRSPAPASSTVSTPWSRGERRASVRRSLAGSSSRGRRSPSSTSMPVSAERTADELGALWFAVDVALTDEVSEAIQRAANELGGLTTLVNNAGVGAIKPIQRYREAQWDHIIDVNLKGTWNGIRAAAALMKLSGGGSIVNVSSVSGMHATRGEAPYSARRRQG